MQLSPLGSLPSFGSPTLEGFDTSDVHIGKRIGGSAGRQYVRFYNKIFVEPVAVEVKTNERTGEVRVLKVEAREIERQMVQIITPGDKNSYDGEAQDFHRRNHWAQYKAFRAGKSAPIGQPIEECSFISPSIATELKYLGVHTVEQLADGSDDLCGQIPSGWELREYARGVAKANNDNKSLGQVNILRGELEKSQALIAQMQSQMNEMKGMLLDSKGKPMEAPKNKVPKKPENLEA